MSSEFGEFHTGSIKQIIPAPPGWILVVPNRDEKGQIHARIHPIMCWALIEQDPGGDLVQAVIDVADFGQPYVDDAVIVAPGQRIAEKLGANLRLHDFEIDTSPWNEDYLREQGWL